MAGKKRSKVDDTVGMSKTARASALKKGGGKAEAFKASADMDRLISLNGGKNAYLLDPRDGKTHRLEVHSEKWARLIGELLVSEHSARINAELIAKGWGDTFVLVSGQAV